jgi:WD40 repeat protein
MTHQLPRHPYHLYHHHPDPLPQEAMQPHAWLINNGATYRRVAEAQARSVEEALRAIQETMAGRGRFKRFVQLCTDKTLRATLPGDVLLGEELAWMLRPENTIQLLPSQVSPPLISYLHDGALHSVSWSPDGSFLAAGDRAGEVRLHRFPTGDQRYSEASYHRHRDWTVSGVAWSPDGTHIASGGYEGEVHVWKPAPTGGYRQAALGSIVICRTEEQGTRIGDQITCLTWSPDSRSVLAGRQDGSLVQWDALTGACLLIIRRHEQSVTDLAYSPDGTHVASASEDGTVRIWNTRADPDQEIICHHRGPVCSLAWSPDGTQLVSSEPGDPSLHVWDPACGVAIQQMPVSVYSTRPHRVRKVAWSPDGSFIAVGGDDGALQVVSIAQRQHVLTYHLGTTYRVFSVAWSPDGQWIAAGGSRRDGYDARVNVWQARLDLASACSSQNEE